MKTIMIMTITMVAVSFLLTPSAAIANDQLWLEFAHPTNPHFILPNPNVRIRMEDLFDIPYTKTIALPTLIILVDYNDVTLQAFHGEFFWEDLVFADPRPGERPSVAEIVRESSNGRLALVPALAGDSHDANNNGVVRGRSSQDYWDLVLRAEPKRAEAIRLADPNFDYCLYDRDNNDIIANDELLLIQIFAMLWTAGPDYTPGCDQHVGHANPAPCQGWAGGNTRQTDPGHVEVGADEPNGPKRVYQWVGGNDEIAKVGVVTEEMCHATFGVGDLYGRDGALWGRVGDGYAVHNFGDTDNDDCGNAVCLADGFKAVQSNTNAGGAGTTCETNDGNDVWFSYTAAASESVIISLRDSKFDTTLAVFSACGGVQLACNDNFDFDGDGTDEPQSQLTFWVQSGTTYWIRVAGAGGATGKYVLTVNGGDGTCPYATDPSNWYPPAPGIYSLMCNNSPRGIRIPHLSPWAKIHLGFVKPQVVTCDGTFTLYDAETQRDFAQQSSEPEALIIYDPCRADPYKEYFIVENRNQADLPDQGLAVWLINENLSESRRVVRLIRRAGHWATDAESLWSGEDPCNYDLTATSTPRNTSWSDGTRSYIEVYDISPSGPAVTFKVRLPGIFVDWTNSGPEDGSPERPFNQVAEGVARIKQVSRTIRIAGGTYPENLLISKACTLKGWRNGSAVIGQ